MSTETAVSNGVIKPIPSMAKKAEMKSAAWLVVTYPCTFPKCAHRDLTVDTLYVPQLTWINREVGKSREVTDWSSQATEREMARYARCRHHALESTVGLDYNRRKGISMTCFEDVLRLASHKREQAEFEREQQREAYRALHAQEKLAHKECREARRVAKSAAAHATPRREKVYGEMVRAAKAPKAAKPAKKGHKKGQPPVKKGNGR